MENELQKIFREEVEKLKAGKFTPVKRYYSWLLENEMLPLTEDRWIGLSTNEEQLRRDFEKLDPENNSFNGFNMVALSTILSKITRVYTSRLSSLPSLSQRLSPSSSINIDNSSKITIKTKKSDSYLRKGDPNFNQHTLKRVSTTAERALASHQNTDVWNQLHGPYV